MSPPIILGYTVTNIEVQIAWNPLAGAQKGGDNVTVDSYDIQMSNALTTWSLIAAGHIGTTYIHTGLTGGTIIYYRIRANNKYGSATSYSAASA